jgi:AcrR family transcriptional regulator
MFHEKFRGCTNYCTCVQNEFEPMGTDAEGQAKGTIHRNRGRPRDEDAKKRILEAALEMLEEFGFASTTAEGIAERAGTSKATVYRWWPDKNAVIIEALGEAAAQELPLPDTGDLNEDVRLQLRNFLNLLTGRHGRMFKAFIVAAQNDREVAETFQTIWREPRRRSVRIGLERYRTKALRENVDLDVVLDVMCGPLYYRLLLGSEAISADYTDALADILLRGIAER